ncbi:MAG: hypothetical protein D6819_07035 [Gammaproteobacteria bacterium]|nr:MAG: hypothetical protein D6819_07035 [Gammaproteobacteria bacterium]
MERCALYQLWPGAQTAPAGRSHEPGRGLGCTAGSAAFAGRCLLRFSAVRRIPFYEGTGRAIEEAWRNSDEGPQHEVTIARPFAMGKYEVTFEEYDRFCEATDRKKP